jgi:hypothetical protein
MEWKDLADKLLPEVKDIGAQLWDGPEDTDLLKFIAQDSAKLAIEAAKGADVSAEFAILKEAIRQRAAQKAIRANGIGEKKFFEYLEFAVRMAKTLL